MAPRRRGLRLAQRKPVTDVPSLGAAIAADPDVQKCAVTRDWNYAMSRGDIVNDLATVPARSRPRSSRTFTTNGSER